MSRRTRRSRRQRGYARSFTIAEKVTDRRAYERLRLPVLAADDELAANDAQRPKTRAECINGMRPCPWVSCPHHLYLEVTEAGGLKILFPSVEPTDLAETCSLDVAERTGGMTLEAVAELTNVTRERARQVELKALVKLGHRAGERGIENAEFPSPEGDTHEAMGDGPSWSTDEDDLGATEVP